MFDNHTISYTRGASHSLLNRNRVRMGDGQVSSQYIFGNRKKMISLSYNFNSVAPDMVNMIDIRDERNP